MLALIAIDRPLVRYQVVSLLCHAGLAALAAVVPVRGRGLEPVEVPVHRCPTLVTDDPGGGRGFRTLESRPVENPWDDDGDGGEENSRGPESGPEQDRSDTPTEPGVSDPAAPGESGPGEGDASREYPEDSGAASVTFPRVDVHGALHEAIIRRVARHYRDGLGTCHREARRKPAPSEGRIAVAFRAYPTGRVDSVRVLHSTLESQFLETCTRRDIRSWVFPEAKGGGIVEIELHILFSVRR